MIDTLYLVDSNALSKLTSQERTSRLFACHCRIPEDVMYEARGYIEAGLEHLVVHTTPATLRQLVKVMDTLASGDRSLVDLYRNKGGADPSIIACALALIQDECDRLIPQEWTIVTDDQAVQRTAGEFKIPVVPSPELLRIFRG